MLGWIENDRSPFYRILAGAGVGKVAKWCKNTVFQILRIFLTSSRATGSLKFGKMPENSQKSCNLKIYFF